jgi:hypothetical protein
MKKFCEVKYLRLIMIVLCQLGFTQSYAQQLKFSKAFAPAEPVANPIEKPFRDGISLNGTWKFSPVEHADKLPLETITHPVLPAQFNWENTPVKVPSPWNVNSFARGDGYGGDFTTYPSYPKSWESIRAGWLMKKIPYRKEWRNKRLILHFEAVGGYAQIFVNRKKAGENFEVFLPFEIDVTDLMKEKQDNELLVWVADAQLFNQPGKYGRRIYVAGSFWGQHAIGIWQDVNLLVKPGINVQNTFVKPSLTNNELNITATINNSSGTPKKINIDGTINPWINLADQKNVLSAPEPKWTMGGTVLTVARQTVTVPANSDIKVDLKVKVSGQLKKWTNEHPNLYGLTLNLKTGSLVTDKQFTRFGWREFAIKQNKFYLNGEPLVLKGDSWHFMGIPQMSRRYAWAWFNMLKDHHTNAVRLHAQPYPQFYLDLADEMGIFVLDETGMWASDGGPKINSEQYWKNSEAHLRKFILRDRNHPSVFGWSVCNENMPVAISVFHSPDSLVKRQQSEINRWIKITSELDPSRDWISGDGETQANLNTGVIIGHYGGSEENYKALSSKGKVWGIGEAGMAYYATPLQSSAYNGDRSFESQQGRMEGVADEATKLINMLKKYDATYMSVFNLVWYGLKPLELGLRDTTRAPQPGDGVFFTNYKENQPGVQPERLGPYTTTLNPGYDPSLPLYKSWPLLDAVSASFATPDMVPGKPKIVSRPVLATIPTAKSIYLLSADKDSVLHKILRNLGVEVKSGTALGSHDLLIVDGIFPPSDVASVNLEKNVLETHGNVLIWGVSPGSIANTNKYLPKSATLTDRKATSFLVKNADATLNNLGNSDFYFSETSERPLMNYGLTGDFVNNGTVLLEASITDWKKWNKRPEYQKTASVLRSERERQPAGGALASMNAENGKIYLFALPYDLLYNGYIGLTRKLLVNFGVIFQNNNARDIPALGPTNKLENALILASFDLSAKNNDAQKISDLLTKTKPEEYFPGQQTGGRFWERISATEGIFDLKKANLNGPSANAFAYISFWMYSPRSLSNLLLEPDMPRLDMHINADNPYSILLNDKLIKESTNSAAFTEGSQEIKAVPLEKGWNHFLIKTVQRSGNGWKLSVDFDSDKKEFLKEIKSGTTHQ